MLLKTKNYFNLRPAVLITAGFIIGILLGSLNEFKGLSFSLFLLVATIFSGVSIFCFHKDKKFIAFVFLISLVCLILGLILIGIDLAGYSQAGKSLFSGTVHEINSENYINGKYYYSVIVKGNFLDNKNVLCLVDLSCTERLYYGSKISFSGNFSLLDKPYLNDVFYSASELSGITVGGLNGLIPIMRNRLLLTLQEHGGDNFALTYALLTGDTVYVSHDVIYKYQMIGVAHLFAVSGLHIGLMYCLLFTLIKLFKVSVKYRLVIICFILFCYVGFCGFSSSSMRAFIIVTVREFAFLTGRKPDGSSNLAISAFIVLIINPTDLFSVSFLLSFSVYLGLILLATPFHRWLSKYLPKTLSKVISSSVIAQLISTPILVDVFGYSSAFSFLFNMALIPFISFLYPFIFLSSVCLAIFSVEFFAFIPKITFAIIEFFLTKARVELFLIEGVTFSYSSIFYYLFLYTFAGKFNFSRKNYTILRIILLVIFIVSFILVDFF